MSYSVNFKGEALVKDDRVERVFYQLQKLRDFPPGTEFATVLQEPTEREPRRLAVFTVISDHPRQTKRAITPKQIITATAMTYERWVEQEKRHRHYAGLSDPIRPIFAGLLRRHLKHYNNLRELT